MQVLGVSTLDGIVLLAPIAILIGTVRRLETQLLEKELASKGLRPHGEVIRGSSFFNSFLAHRIVLTRLSRALDLDPLIQLVDDHVNGIPQLQETGITDLGLLAEVRLLTVEHFVDWCLLR